MCIRDSDKGSPNLDKFEVTAKEVPMEKYTITSSVAEGEQGTISPLGAVEVEEGSSKEFEMKPNEGYAVKDVVVDGKSVGSRTKYTFEEVLANGHTITATFEKEMYAEDNRFEFPVDGNAKTLEAERLEAKNVEDPSDGQWKMEVKEADWASGGKFVNSMNKGDTPVSYTHLCDELKFGIAGEEIFPNRKIGFMRDGVSNLKFHLFSGFGMMKC